MGICGKLIGGCFAKMRIFLEIDAELFKTRSASCLKTKSANFYEMRISAEIDAVLFQLKCGDKIKTSLQKRNFCREECDGMLWEY